MLITWYVLTVCGELKRELFYAKFYADFYANLRQAFYFGLFFMVIFMLVLKVSSLYWFIISMTPRGTLELLYTCRAQLMVYLLRSAQTIVL